MQSQINLSDPAVKDAIAQAVSAATADMNDRLANAYQQVEGLRDELENVEQKYTAAEQIGQELLSRNKEYEIKLSAFQESVDSKFPLNDRYEAAKKVIDELVQRVRSLKVVESRCDAAERLLTELVARCRRDRMVRHVDTLLANESREVGRALRPILLKSNTLGEANEQYSAFKLLEGKTSRKSSVVESAKPETPQFKPLRQVKSEGALPIGNTVEEQTSLVEGTAFEFSAEGTSLNESVLTARALMKRMKTA